MNWFYASEGQQKGPVTELELPTLVHNGTIRPETLVWHAGMPEWTPYGKVAAASTASDAPAPAEDAPLRLLGATVICSQCGGVVPADQVQQHGNARICATCKPFFGQQLQEGARPAADLQYAGFGIRLGAKIIDGLILGAVCLGPVVVWGFMKGLAGEVPSISESFAVQAVFQLIYFLVNGAFTIFFLGKFGATPGKMACGLKVVNADGSNLSWGKAAGRYLAEILSGIICYIGYIMAAFDQPQHRAMHDHICTTRVVYKPRS